MFRVSLLFVSALVLTLLAALNACAGYLDRFGGHKAAAGVELDASRIDDPKDAYSAPSCAASLMIEYEKSAMPKSNDPSRMSTITGRLIASSTRLCPFSLDLMVCFFIF